MSSETGSRRLRRPALDKTISDLILSVKLVLVIDRAVALIDFSISFRIPDKKGLSLGLSLIGMAAGAAERSFPISIPLAIGLSK